MNGAAQCVANISKEFHEIVDDEKNGIAEQQVKLFAKIFKMLKIYNVQYKKVFSKNLLSHSSGTNPNTSKNSILGKS